MEELGGGLGLDRVQETLQEPPETVYEALAVHVPTPGLKPENLAV